MAQQEFMQMQHSESIVAQMAATVLAGLIQKQAFSSTNEDELIERAVSIAIKLAHRAEKRVQSDEEWLEKNKASGFLAG